MKRPRWMSMSAMGRARLVCAIVLGTIFPAALGTGCGRESAGEFDDLRQMEFQVDPALLGDAIADSAAGISIRPPAGFHPANPNVVAQVQAAARAEAVAGDSLRSFPVVIYGRPEAMGLFSLSRFPDPPENGVTRAWLDAYGEAVQRSVAPVEPQMDLFRRGEIRVRQLLVQNEAMVLFRLIAWLPDGEPLQVDYLIPRAEYEGAVRALESSIGSLSPL